MKLLVACLGVAALASTCWQGGTPADGAAKPGGDAPDEPLAKADVPGDLGQKAYRHVERLCSFGARHTGSPGWQYAIDYIAVELQKLGLRPVRDRWQDPKEQLTFENIVVTIPGKSPDKIVIGAHHDTKKTSGHTDDPSHNFPFVGANDSGSGVGLLLALAAVLKDREHEATIELAFFDGEESVPYRWDMDRALFGSRRYVSRYQEEHRRDSRHPAVRALILLDMVGAADLSIDDEGHSDARLKKIFRRAAEACGHSDFFFRRDQTVSDDHLPFLDAGIPAIDLIDIADNEQWHTADDTIEHISAVSLKVVGEVVLTALPEVERRFVVAPANLRLPSSRR